MEKAEYSDPPRVEPSLNALFVTGWAAGFSYLDADGEVWEWWAADDHGGLTRLTRVPDGRHKVLVIAIAAARLAELADWLPERPAAAIECGVCRGTKRPRPPFDRAFCTTCCALGWVLPDNSES
jgi:hypothetical protein